MSQIRFGLVAVLALMLAACGQSAQQQEANSSVSPSIEDPMESTAQHAPLPPVDAALVGAASGMFTAIEPTELQITAAPTIMESLEPLLGVENQEGGESLHLSVTEQGDAAVADIVRTGIPDDSVSGGHIRIEYRREEDGWYPTNAYRRVLCGRGAEAGQWTAGLCP
jgi:hypothetical protein